MNEIHWWSVLRERTTKIMRTYFIFLLTLAETLAVTAPKLCAIDRSSSATTEQSSGDATTKGLAWAKYRRECKELSTSLDNLLAQGKFKDAAKLGERLLA